MMRSRHRLTIHAHQFPALEMSPTVSPAFTVPVTPIESMTTARVALITGVTGQDGRYLAEFDFRYTNRIANGYDDAERADVALKGIVGKRLTYRRTNSPVVA